MKLEQWQKVKKLRPLESMTQNFKITPKYYVKYKSLANLKKSVNESKKCRNGRSYFYREKVNLKRSVTEEYCFKSKEAHKATKNSKKQNPTKNLILNGERYIAETWQNSRRRRYNQCAQKICWTWLCSGKVIRKKLWGF